MVARIAIMAVLLAASATARADSPKLVAARVALDEIRYDDAQRLLAAALAEGGHAPPAMREIYARSGDVAVVLGQRDVGEQYYRRWLAIDPDARLGPDIAPKLREPFVAAQAFIEAHGRLRATVTRSPRGDLEVVVHQPMAMAVAVAFAGRGSVALSARGHAVLSGGGRGEPPGARIWILDERANRLIELDVSAAPEAGGSSRAYLLSGAGALLGFVGAGALARLARSEQRELDMLVGDNTLYYADLLARRDRIRRISYAAVGAGTAGAILAVTTVVLFRRRSPTRVVPLVTPDAAGVSLVARF